MLFIFKSLWRRWRRYNKTRAWASIKLSTDLDRWEGSYKYKGKAQFLHIFAYSKISLNWCIVNTGLGKMVDVHWIYLILLVNERIKHDLPRLLNTSPGQRNVVNLWNINKVIQSFPVFGNQISADLSLLLSQNFVSVSWIELLFGYRNFDSRWAFPMVWLFYVGREVR